LEVVRKDFPILERTMAGGHPLVYLDSANTSQKPQVVIDTMVDHLERHNANIARAMHQLGAESTEAFESARDKVAAFSEHLRHPIALALRAAGAHDDVAAGHSGTGIVAVDDDLRDPAIVALGWGRGCSKARRERRGRKQNGTFHDCTPILGSVREQRLNIRLCSSSRCWTGIQIRLESEIAARQPARINAESSG
jgi:hypothetical protein